LGRIPNRPTMLERSVLRVFSDWGCPSARLGSLRGGPRARRILLGDQQSLAEGVGQHRARIRRLCARTVAPTMAA